MSIVKASAVFTRGDTAAAIKAVLQGRVIPAVERSQGILVDEARTLAPVLTGELRDSIHAEAVVDTGRQIVGSVVADSEHAGFVELGTGIRGAASGGGDNYSPDWPGMVAQPYLRPALDSARAAVLEEFES